ncbi:MAG: zf-HC2 domain-containing protein [Nitrospirae bacterium]|nr:zf-HC2 domain-containing protein [Candidatus Manganitrophaceae bacterium]
MRCRELKEHLPAYLREEVPPDLRQRIKSHLRGCKKCKAGMEEMKADTVAPMGKKERTAFPRLEVSTASAEESASPSTEKEGFSSGLKYPIPVAAMALLVIGGVYFYQRGGSDLKADPSAMEKEAAPVVETAGTPSPSETAGKGPSQTPASAAPVVLVTEAPPTPPVKVQKAESRSLPHAEGRSTVGKIMEMKLLLISRDVTAVAERVESHAAAASGKVLKKNQNEMEMRLVLLVPAERYEGFLESLQSLGLVKELSKKPPPPHGPVRVAVTIQ